MKNFTLKTKTIAAAASIVLMGASAGSAATFDFVSIADGADAFGNTINGVEKNWLQTTFAGGLMIDGITLIASGSNVNGADADAFFDKGVAGLGVCSSISCATGVQGSITSDDNVTIGETLRLAFDQVVSLTDIIFTETGNDDGDNNGHQLMNGSIGFGADSLTIVNGEVTGGFELLSSLSIFDFRFTGDEFYLASATAVSAVPLPAGMWLMLTGFGALGVARRRKNAAEA